MHYKVRTPCSVADPNHFLAGSESDRLNSPNPDPHSCFTFPLYLAKKIADSVLKFKYLSCFPIVECAVSGVIFISESRSKNIELLEEKKNPPSFSSD